MDLAPRTVADFYADVMSTLAALKIEVKIHAHPDEVANPIPFADDRAHKSYDREYVERFHRLLISVDKVLKNFRARFIGKCSPVHFFWGSFDLAVTRFSGRACAAPVRSPICRNDAGSLLARSEQRRILARRRRDQGSCVLLLHDARAGRIQDLPRCFRSPRSIIRESASSFCMYDDIRSAAASQSARPNRN